MTWQEVVLESVDMLTDVVVVLGLFWLIVSVAHAIAIGKRG